MATVTLVICACALCRSQTALASEQLTIIGENGVYTYSAPQIEYYFGGGRLLRMNEIVDEICRKEYVPPRDAYVAFYPDKKTKFVPQKETYGKAVDKERLTDDIVTALSVGGGAVKAAYNTVNPQIYYKDLSTDIVERARFSTSFSGSSKERISNISTAAKAVNGTVLMSGEEFSFNDTVGKRSESSGYKTAKIIVDGNFVDGIGGGVCQVSTTLYNAALLSGLKVSEYHPHTLAVSYVESSFDAMVSYGSSDLRFINVTDKPVYIKGYVADGKVNFIVYGEKPDCVYERVSKITEVTPFKETKIFNPSLDENEYIIRVHGKNGVKSCGYLVKKSGGKVIYEKLLRNDVYRSVEGVTETGDRSCEKPQRSS